MPKRARKLAAFTCFALPAIVLSSTAADSFGVILYRSAQRNTSAPTGTFANSGWQWQGQFGPFLGTAIGSQYFITAQHIGGAPNFVYNGTSYNIDGSFGSGGFVDGPNSDLRIWKVQGTLPNWAPLYDAATDGSEIGKTMVVIGRGASRGDEVYSEVVTGGSNQGQNGGISGDIGSNGYNPGELKGWRWAVFDSVQAWGTNVVSGIFNSGPTGQVIGFDFDRNGLF